MRAGMSHEPDQREVCAYDPVLSTSEVQVVNQGHGARSGTRICI